MSAEKEGSTDGYEVDSRLVDYKEMYDRWSLDRKGQVPWSVVQARLLHGNNLQIAHALRQPVLFGFDKRGNPLVADESVRPALTNRETSYAGARSAVVRDGHQMFPPLLPANPPGRSLKLPDSVWLLYSQTQGLFASADGLQWAAKSSEIRQFEEFIGGPFVGPPRRIGHRVSSFLDSGPQNLSCAFVINFAYGDPGHSDFTYVTEGGEYDGIERGVRRMFRLV
ncbi:MAG: hypothetical protein WC777_03180 [Candidatus Gracilibacteria bacterium]|jgi:hypothetical protein